MEMKATKQTSIIISNNKSQSYRLNSSDNCAMQDTFILHSKGLFDCLDFSDQTKKILHLNSKTKARH